MARINLLPWREEKRQRKNKEFLTLIVMIAILTGLAVFATLFFFNNQLKEQKAANELITTENNKLDKVLKEIEELEQTKAAIIARMTVIQDLQGKRPLPVRVWDDLSKATPNSLFLTQLERKEKQLILIGKANDPNVVSEFISNLDNSKWMTGSSVQEIKKSDKALVKSGEKTDDIIYPEDGYVTFKLSTNVYSKVKNPEEENEDADQKEESGKETDSTKKDESGKEADSTKKEESGKEADSTKKEESGKETDSDKKATSGESGGNK